MPLEGVPDVDMRGDESDWRLFYGSWLNDLGYALTCVYLGSEDRLDGRQALHGSVVHVGEELVILAGPSPRGVGHACVGNLGFDDFDVVHDPHPSRAGLEQVVRFYMVTPMLRPTALSDGSE